MVSDPGRRGEAGESGDNVRLCVVVFADQLIPQAGYSEQCCCRQAPECVHQH